MATKEFIEVGGRILDYKTYREQAATLQRMILKDVKLYLRTLGFVSVAHKTNQDMDQEHRWYHQGLDVQCELRIKKLSPEEFA